MTKASARAPAQDHSIVYTVVTAFVLLMVGFLSVWFYQKKVAGSEEQVAYAKLPRMVMSMQGHSVAASLAIQTTAADAGWVKKNKHHLEGALKTVLMTTDPQHMLAPNGLQALQHALKQAGNAALGTDKVQEVLLTEFLVSSLND